MLTVATAALIGWLLSWAVAAQMGKFISIIGSSPVWERNAISGAARYLSSAQVVQIEELDLQLQDGRSSNIGRR